MVKGKQMSLAEKAKIIALAEQNVSNHEIAVKTSFNESSVRRFLKKCRETEKLERTKGSGRKKCKNEREKMNGCYYENKSPGSLQKCCRNYI